MIEPEIDFAQLERISRRSLRMYDLSRRERDICEVIIDLSFAAGRQSAVIPQLQAFVDLTGLDKGDVSRVLQLLEARGVIQRQGPREARVYAFIPSASFWSQKTPRFDSNRAIARLDDLERINESAPAVEPCGQSKLPLPADPPGLDEGMAMAARSDAGRALRAGLADRAGSEPDWHQTDGLVKRQSGVGETPIRAGEIGETPIGQSPIPGRNVKKNVTVQNVLHNVAVGNSPTSQTEARFRDPEKNYVFERLEGECCRSTTGRSDFEQYRPAWINRVGKWSQVIQQALGDLKVFRDNPANKLRKPAGAWIYRRCKTLRKDFHLW